MCVVCYVRQSSSNTKKRYLIYFVHSTLLSFCSLSLSLSVFLFPKNLSRSFTAVAVLLFCLVPVLFYFFWKLKFDRHYIISYRRCINICVCVCVVLQPHTECLFAHRTIMHLDYLYILPKWLFVQRILQCDRRSASMHRIKNKKRMRLKCKHTANLIISSSKNKFRHCVYRATPHSSRSYETKPHLYLGNIYFAITLWISNVNLWSNLW